MKHSDYDAVHQAQWEQEQQRPFDWQDRVVIGAGWVAVVALIGILVYGG
jgi:hypothetical protein